MIPGPEMIPKLIPRQEMIVINTPYSKMAAILDILLFSFKLDIDASFKARYSFEFSAQERGIKG